MKWIIVISSALLVTTLHAMPNNVQGLITRSDMMLDSNGDICEFCKEVMAFAKHFVDKPEPELAAKLKEECGKLDNPFVATLCKSIVTKYLPKLYEVLGTDATPEELCQKTKLCTLKQLKPQPIVAPVTNENPAVTASVSVCQVCTVVVAVAKEFGDISEPKLEVLLKKTCKKLNNFEATCDKLIEDFLPQIIQYLDGNIEPHQVCKLLKLCKDDRDLTSAQFIQTILTPKSLVSAERASPTTNQATSMEKTIKCLLCVPIMKEAKKFGGLLEPEVEAGLLLVCNKAGVLMQPCRHLVQEYVPQFYMYLEGPASAETLCQKIRLCP